MIADPRFLELVAEPDHLAHFHLHPVVGLRHSLQALHHPVRNRLPHPGEKDQAVLAG